MGQLRSAEVKASTSKDGMVWSSYEDSPASVPVTGTTAALSSSPATKAVRKSGMSDGDGGDPSAPRGSKSAPGTQNRK